MKLEEVNIGEAAECMAVNALAPFLLNGKLKALMIKGNEDKKVPRFIVNVSAMEGKFYRFKSANHPHTNAAKAALNMMTRTSAQDYVQSAIHMTAVDTGEFSLKHAGLHVSGDWKHFCNLCACLRRHSAIQLQLSRLAIDQSAHSLFLS